MNDILNQNEDYMSINTTLITLIMTAMLSLSVSAGEVYEFVEEWSFRDPTEPFVLHDLSRTWMPYDTFGIALYDDGSILVADRLTESLQHWKAGDGPEWAEGSLGEGPEDHRRYGEPVVWGEGFVARSDCAPRSRIIFRDGSGLYQDSVTIDGVDELVRLFWSGSAGIGIGLAMTGNPMAGGSIVCRMIRLDSKGITTKTLDLREQSMDALGSREMLPERDMWLLPRISVSTDGYTFIHPDPYSDVIECYDADLNQLWTIHGGWTPAAKTDARRIFIESFAGPAVELDDLDHTVSALHARPGGTVWIEPMVTHDPAATTRRFQAFGPNGVPAGDVIIEGLPAAPGTILLNADRLLWLRHQTTDHIPGTPHFISGTITRVDE